MPVHRMPGGRTGTVYALRHELDRWAGLGQGLDKTISSPPMQKGTPARSVRWRARWALLALLPGLILALAGGMVADRLASDIEPIDVALPADPRLSSQFLAARDLTAERRATGLERAILLLEDVTRSAPSFAQGHAALAEALLLSREFGPRPDEEAYQRARQAARIAVRLDPAGTDGHRLLGFIAYWADGDFSEASAQFRRALDLSPDDAMVHFWYGNVLSDHGDHDEALRLLRRAQLLQPGSVAIQTDLAWARWAAGQDTAAVAALRDIVRRHPDFPVAHDCLSIIALFRGDDESYLRHFTKFADARRDARLMTRAGELQAALATQGSPAMHRLLWRYANEDLSRNDGSSEWVAAIASINRQRSDMLRFLEQSAQRSEHWGQSGLIRRAEQIWKNDPEIIRHLQPMRLPRDAEASR